METKNIKFLKYINPALRILTGLMFIVSGIFKYTGIEAFKYTINAFNFFNPGISNILSYIIPAIEIILGIILTLGVFIKFASIHINVLVILFAIVTYSAVINNLELSCNCFGGLWDMKFSWYHLGFLFLIFILNVIFIIDYNDTWSFEKIIRRKLAVVNKEVLYRTLIIFFMVLGIVILILASLINFTDTGKNFKEKLSRKLSLSGIINTGKYSMVKKISVDDAYEAYMSKDGYIFIDVRTQDEYSQEHIKDSIHIPSSDFNERVSELPEDRPIITYCDGSTCERSGYAAQILMDHGFTEVYEMSGGGILEWKEKGYPFERGD